MRARKLYACQGGCGRYVIRPNRTDRRKYCPECACAAVAANAIQLHTEALARRGLIPFHPPVEIPAPLRRTA